MKKILIIFIFTLGSFFANAQGELCGTKEPKIPLRITQNMLDSLKGITTINLPYCVRVYITVFADANGTNRAATDADILRQFQNMVNQYQSHNICFMLIKIRQVNNTDLNSHNADTEEAELNPYLQSNCLNMFIHNSLTSNSGGLNGSAYGIPNTYMSESGGAIASTTNISTMGHEAGHCFGLYHTFQRFGNPSIQENVTRISNNNCYNCATEGDLLCDTPADRVGTPDDDNVNSLCQYNGEDQDACNVTFTPMTTNMMAYGFRACRNVFTNGQGGRMRTIIAATPSLLALINEDVLNRPSSANSTITWSVTDGFDTARDDLYIANFANDAFNSTGSAERILQAKRVHLKPGTHFYPTTGRVHVKANPYCN